MLSNMASDFKKRYLFYNICVTYSTEIILLIEHKFYALCRL